MPNPRAVSAQVPEDLDKLVRQALAGGRVDRVRAALETPVSGTALSADPRVHERPPVETQFVGSAKPPVSNSATSDPPITPPASGSVALALDSEEDVFDRLVRAASAARAVWDAGNRGEAATWLDQLALDLQLARVRAAQAPTTVPTSAVTAAPPQVAQAPAVSALETFVELPPYRHPWLLGVDGPGDVGRAKSLADAMDVDIATARQFALSQSPRIVLRSDTRLELDRKAGRIRANVGLEAVVFSRDGLRAQGPVQTVLRAKGVRAFAVADGPAWRDEDVAAGCQDPDSLDASGAVLVVPGDVVVRKYRLGRDGGRGRGEAVKLGGERRIGVVDLHGPNLFVRIVQGITDLRGFPGYDSQSTLRSIRSLTKRAWQWWPKARLTAPRTARPGDQPSLADVREAPDGVSLGGWAEWEEHSRLARLLAGLA